MNTPVAIYKPLTSASPDEIRAALRALFDQFPAADGDARGKLLGYVLALDGEPKWAVESAVKKFLRGVIEDHDGRFLPTSAEIARVVRAESDFVRRQRDRENYPKPAMFKYSPFRTRKLDIEGDFPSRPELKRWKMPVGSVVVTEDAIVQYPDGSRETWGEIRRRLRGDPLRKTA